MRNIILGILATVVLAVGASYGLATLQQSATERYTVPSSVRINPGS